MKKITIYTAADKRPDFIHLQYETLKKYIKDDFEYIIFNNAIDSKYRRNEISRICKEKNIKCILVKKDTKYNTIGGQKAISWLGSYKNANVGTGYPIQWAWKDICEYNKDKIFMFFDSDMFLCNPVSFNDELKNYDAALIMQYRGLSDPNKEKLVSYMWNAICIFDVEKIKNLSELNWDCGLIKKSYINGYSVDVGGYTHFWLKENKLKIRCLSEYTIVDHEDKKDNTRKIDYILGNYYGSINYNINDNSIKNNSEMPDKILPHLPTNFGKILNKKILKYFQKFDLHHTTYPKPTFLGLIEFETFNEEIKPFLIHNKAGSGYLGLGYEYGKEKLSFIKKIVGIRNISDEETKKKYFFNIPDLFRMNIKTVAKIILKKISMIDLLK